MAKVYVTWQLPTEGLEALKKKHQVDVNCSQSPLSRDQLLEVVENYDAVICLLNDEIDKEVIAAAQGRVKIFANYAVGYDNIDVEAARQAGIHVSNTPGVLTEATADLAWTLMLAAARNLIPAHNHAAGGKFSGWHPTAFLGRDLHGATLGIIGAGRIGQAVARRAQGFGLQVLFYNKSPRPRLEHSGNARWSDLDELLRSSDFISLHVPLTEETRHMLDSKRLAMLKPTAVVVNTARGPIIDEAALAKALKERKIFAAGLDVYEHEPEIHPDLMGLDNVVLAPHIGSASWRTRLKMARMAAANVEAVLAGRPPVNPV